MLCLSGFELYSRWVPLKKLLAVYTEHLYESLGDKWNENLFSLSLLYQNPNRPNNIENFQTIKFTRISLSFLKYHCCQTSFSSASI